jgi:saccharopine dehydrogenase-like NADP-dependent oxidoreductase
VEFEGATFSPIRFVASRFPRPVDLSGKIHGEVCVGALAEGAIAGHPVRRYLHQITSHDEAWERWGVQGTAWQTGASAVCAVRQFARGEIALRGVVAPEQLDPAAFLAEMGRVGLSVGSVDLPAG